MKKILISIIRLYQKYLSPDHSICVQGKNRPPYCKYYPTCSNYMIESLEKKGVFWGLIKGTGRILRCMPWSKGGIDLVDKK